MREDEKGFYEPLTLDEGVRYARYYRIRFGVPTIRVWHYWHKPVFGSVAFSTDDDYQSAREAGTPFIGAREGIGKLDYYYIRRFPWRRWQKKSIACAARRVWGARAICR